MNFLKKKKKKNISFVKIFTQIYTFYWKKNRWYDFQKKKIFFLES